jgi:hypothetical protein
MTGYPAAARHPRNRHQLRTGADGMRTCLRCGVRFHMNAPRSEVPECTSLPLPALPDVRELPLAAESNE